MQEPAECAWHDVNRCVGLDELARCAMLSPQELGELMDYGVLAGSARDDDGTLFTADCVGPLREAARLRRVFDLDVFTMGLLYGYLARVQVLESELRSSRARLPRMLQEPA